MTKHLFLGLAIGINGLLIQSCGSGENITEQKKESVTFYEVPLVCGAAPEIGCGSRIKPLFLDTEKETQIKESWSNRPGTVIAIVWNGEIHEELIQSLFKKHDIAATLITDSLEIERQTTSMKGADKWYKGMEIDELSMEEAGVIAETMTSVAKDDSLINDEEAEIIKADIEEYFKKDLLVVRTCQDLKSQETQEKWSRDTYDIYLKHIGKERADLVSISYQKYQESCQMESACTEDSKKECCKKPE